MLGDETVKFWRAQALPTSGARTATDAASTSAPVPGMVLAATADGIDVAAGDGVVRLTELQRAGGKRLSAGDFLRGFGVAAGRVFG